MDGSPEKPVRRFRISRKAGDSISLDFDPPLKSDALFDAFREAYPNEPNHQARHRRAVLEFFLNELENEGQSGSSSPSNSSSHHSSINSSSTGQTHDAGKSKIVTASPVQQSTSTIRTPPKKLKVSCDRSKMESMMYDFGLSQPGRKNQIPKKRMDDQRRKEYRITKEHGACEYHRKRKKQCDCYLPKEHTRTTVNRSHKLPSSAQESGSDLNSSTSPASDHTSRSHSLFPDSQVTPMDGKAPNFGTGSYQNNPGAFRALNELPDMHMPNDSLHTLQTSHMSSVAIESPYSSSANGSQFQPNAPVSIHGSTSLTHSSFGELLPYGSIRNQVNLYAMPRNSDYSPFNLAQTDPLAEQQFGFCAPEANLEGPMMFHTDAPGFPPPGVPLACGPNQEDLFHSSESLVGPMYQNTAKMLGSRLLSESVSKNPSSTRALETNADHDSLWAEEGSTYRHADDHLLRGELWSYSSFLERWPKHNDQHSELPLAIDHSIVQGPVDRVLEMSHWLAGQEPWTTYDVTTKSRAPQPSEATSETNDVDSVRSSSFGEVQLWNDTPPTSLTQSTSGLGQSAKPQTTGSRPRGSSASWTRENRLVIGIDYGTTFTGVAHTVPKSTTVALKDIEITTDCRNTFARKTPSIISYSSADREKKHQWGYDIDSDSVTMVHTKLELDNLNFDRHSLESLEDLDCNPVNSRHDLDQISTIPSRDFVQYGSKKHTAEPDPPMSPLTALDSDYGISPDNRDPSQSTDPRHDKQSHHMTTGLFCSLAAAGLINAVLIANRVSTHFYKLAAPHSRANARMLRWANEIDELATTLKQIKTCVDNMEFHPRKLQTCCPHDTSESDIANICDKDVWDRAPNDSSHTKESTIDTLTTSHPPRQRRCLDPTMERSLSTKASMSTRTQQPQTWALPLLRSERSIAMTAWSLLILLLVWMDVLISRRASGYCSSTSHSTTPPLNLPGPGFRTSHAWSCLFVIGTLFAHQVRLSQVIDRVFGECKIIWILSIALASIRASVWTSRRRVSDDTEWRTRVHDWKLQQDEVRVSGKALDLEFVRSDNNPVNPTCNMEKGREAVVWFLQRSKAESAVHLHGSHFRPAFDGWTESPTGIERNCVSSDKQSRLSLYYYDAMRHLIVRAKAQLEHANDILRSFKLIERQLHFNHQTQGRFFSNFTHFRRWLGRSLMVRNGFEKW